MLVSAADLWLGGLMIFAIVICAIAGALACTWIITSSSLFGDACKKAPLLQAWVALLAATGAVSWAGFAPSCSACWSSGRALSRRHAKWLAAAFAVIVT